MARFAQLFSGFATPLSADSEALFEFIWKLGITSGVPKLAAGTAGKMTLRRRFSSALFETAAII